MENYEFYSPEKEKQEEPNQSEKKPHSFKKKKNNKKILAMALIFGLVAGSVFAGTSLLGQQVISHVESRNADISKTEPVQDAQSSESSTTSTALNAADIAENAMPAVVSITNMSVKEVESFFGSEQFTVKSAGSGVIVGEDDEVLYIVTNKHVVEDTSALTVTFIDDSSIEASVKGESTLLDIAVVTVRKANLSDSTLNKIKSATIGDSSSVRVGDPVVAIGNALGYGQSVTTGIISAKDREISDIQGKYIQTDAAINPGNSGGALLDASGAIIGINSAKIQDASVEGMGYAIPINDVVNIVNGLNSDGTRTEVAENERGYLGISCRTVDSETAALYNMPIGAYVYKVNKGSGADKAGIKKEMIIVAVDNQEVASADDLQRLISTYKAKETVSLRVKVPDKKYSYKDKKIDVSLGTAKS